MDVLMVDGEVFTLTHQETRHSCPPLLHWPHQLSLLAIYPSLLLLFWGIFFSYRPFFLLHLLSQLISSYLLSFLSLVKFSFSCLLPLLISSYLPSFLSHLTLSFCLLPLLIFSYLPFFLSHLTLLSVYLFFYIYFSFPLFSFACSFNIFLSLFSAPSHFLRHSLFLHSLFLPPPPYFLSLFFPSLILLYACRALLFMFFLSLLFTLLTSHPSPPLHFSCAVLYFFFPSVSLSSTSIFSSFPPFLFSPSPIFLRLTLIPHLHPYPSPFTHFAPSSTSASCSAFTVLLFPCGLLSFPSPSALFYNLLF